MSARPNESRRFRLEYLCMAYNSATNPRALRTAHEHHRCQQVARAALNRLAAEGYRNGYHYVESALDGRLWVRS